MDGNVQAVFERQLDSVLEANLQLAVVNELVDARRIGENGRVDGMRLVGFENVWEAALAAVCSDGFQFPREDTGAMEVPVAGRAGAGGFWAGLCAKRAKAAPTKRPARTIANRDRAHCEAIFLVLAPKMDRFKVPLSVFIVIYTL